MLLEKSFTHAETGEGLSDLRVVDGMDCAPCNLVNGTKWGGRGGKAFILRDFKQHCSYNGPMLKFHKRGNIVDKNLLKYSLFVVVI